MYSDLKKSASYPKKLTVLSLATVLFGFGCMLLGYLFLPFAASAYTALLLFENKNRRILSYVIPVALAAVNVLLNGFFSVEGVVYVAVGVLIYFLHQKKRTKNESVFWVTFTISFFIVLSFVFVGFSTNSSASFGSLRDFYAGVYDSLKKIFVELISNLHTEDESGVLYYVFTREYAEDFFHSLILTLPSFVIIAAFLLAGITFKLFSMYRARILDEESVMEWELMPPKFIAYSYIIFSILGALASSSSDIFSVSLANISNVLLAVFAYIGLKITFGIVKNARGTAFSILFILVAVVLFGGTALTLLSYIGVFFSIINRTSTTEN